MLLSLVSVVPWTYMHACNINICVYLSSLYSDLLSENSDFVDLERCLIFFICNNLTHNTFALIL